MSSASATRPEPAGCRKTGYIGYREGSLYHAIRTGDLFWLTVGLLMTSVLLLGLLYRERQGPGGIGRESLKLLGIYAGAVTLQATLG